MSEFYSYEDYCICKTYMYDECIAETHECNCEHDNNRKCLAKFDNCIKNQKRMRKKSKKNKNDLDKN